MRETQGRADRDFEMRRTLAAIGASLVVPFPLQALLLILHHNMVNVWWNVPDWLDWIGYLPTIISADVGFGFLAWRYRRFAVVIGIVYLPIMFAALVFFGLYVVGYFYDLHL
jgi:hypothetical protein